MATGGAGTVGTAGPVGDSAVLGPWGTPRRGASAPDGWPAALGAGEDGVCGSTGTAGGPIPAPGRSVGFPTTGARGGVWLTSGAAV